jgi:hypothetical protein
MIKKFNSCTVERIFENFKVKVGLIFKVARPNFGKAAEYLDRKYFVILFSPSG